MDILAGNCWKLLLEIAGNYLIKLEMLEMAGNGWKWLEIAGNYWKLLEAQHRGSPSVATAMLAWESFLQSTAGICYLPRNAATAAS